MSPCASYDIRPEVSGGSGDLTVSILGEDNDQNCPFDVIESIGYRVVVGGLDGKVQVTVVHRWLDANWEDELVQAGKLML